MAAAPAVYSPGIRTWIVGNWEFGILDSEIKKIIKAAGKLVFLLYILALIYFLFFSEQYGRTDYAERDYNYNLNPFQEIKRFWIYREQLGFFAVATNLFGNVAGFIPFGFILPLINKNTRGFLFITFSGFALSLCVETIQLISKVGCFDVDDLFLNTIGAAAGYIFFAACHSIYSRRKENGEEAD